MLQAHNISGFDVTGSLPREVRRSIAFVGGGMAGTVAATRLIRQSKRPLHIRIFDPRLDLGRGLAYSTLLFAHKLNGPAKSFSLRPEDPAHFTRWLAQAARRGGWRDFDDPALAHAPRHVYGDYIRAELTSALDDAGGRAVLDHITQAVDDVRLSGTSVEIGTGDGRTFPADHVVLASGALPAAAGRHVAPSVLASGRYFDGPWEIDAIERLTEAQHVTLIGSSLTMVDAVVALETAGYRGRYQVISRRGLTPEPRREVPPWPEFLPAVPSSGWTARALLRVVRNELHRAKAQGEDWQRLVPAVRPHLDALWSSASLAERQRFLRHVRPYWDLFLHRLPPASAKAVDTVVQSGRLDVLAATVVDIDGDREGAIQVRARKRADGSIATVASDAVVNCAGHDYRWEPARGSALVRSLFTQGLIRPGNLDIGIDADRRTLAVIDAHGRPVPQLSTLGASLRSVFFESGTIGELVKQAVLLAPRLELS